MGPIWQAQLGESLVMLIGPSWEPNLLPYWAPNLGPIRLPNLCSAIRATLGQRQIRQNPGLALNAHSGNELELCADVVVSAEARRSISVGGAGAPPVQKNRRRRGVGGPKQFFLRFMKKFRSILN